MAACGAAVGYVLGGVLALLLAGNWLAQYSQLTSAQNDASFVEARSLLDVLKGSRSGYCTDAEMAYFRELVFRSEYLKDAGRIHGGKIDCSATSGRPTKTVGEFKPDSNNRDNDIIAYSNLVPIRDANLKRAGLQLGDAYVVFGSHLPASPGPVSMHLAINVKDAEAGDSGLAPTGMLDNNGPNPAAGWRAHLDNKLFATRCSKLHFNCVTAFTSIREALHGEASAIAGTSLTGGALGIFCGMAFSFMYRRSRDLCQQLRRAVERDKLEIAYQPIVNLSTRKIVGAEALSRWTDEEGNVVGPDSFIKIAEEHGFVGEITKRVIQRTLRDFSKTIQNRPSLRLSVNVTAPDLIDPEFLPMLEEALKRYKVSPKNVVFEITDRSTADSAVAMETIRILRRNGHSIHIDDFGTGYSNLDRLLYLFADTIKIDQAFTKVIGTESVAVAILPQILAMAKSLNLEVVVEGVETDRQADYFSLGAEKMFGQGFLFGRPVSIEEFLSLLADDMSKMQVSSDHAAARVVNPAGLQIVGTRTA